MSNKNSAVYRCKIDQSVVKRDEFQAIFPAEVEKNVPVVQESFKSVCRAVCLCPKKRSNNKAKFGHFQTVTRICSSVEEIEKRIEERIGLTLVKNCLLRLQSSCRFNDELENTLEYYLAYVKDLKSKGSHLERDLQFKGQNFHELCLTAKDNLTFWSLFLEKCTQERRFKIVFAPLEREITIAHNSLLKLIGRFPLYISTILIYVLDIAFYLKWDLPESFIKDISSAIEDMNRLCEYSQSIQNESYVVFKSRPIGHFSDSSTCVLFGMCASTGQDNTETAISLQSLFNKTAKRSAHVLGDQLFSFLHEQKQVIECIASMNRKHKPVSNSNPDIAKTIIAYPRNEHQFITELISKLATSMTLMSSVSIDKKLVVHRSLPQKGLYHEDEQYMTESDSQEEHSLDGASHSILKHNTSSQRLSKRVQWHHSIDVDVKAQMSVLYMDTLWSVAPITICQMMEMLSYGREARGVLGPLPLWSDTILVNAITALESTTFTDSLETEQTKCIQLVCRYLYCFSILSSWDKDYCKLLGVARRDKCSPSSCPEEETPSCETVSLMVDLLHTLSNFFLVAHKWDHHLGTSDLSSIYMITDLSASVLPFISRLQALLRFGYGWFDTKLYHFLSGWNLSSFLMLVHTDLDLILEQAQATLVTLRPLGIGQGGNTSWFSLPVQLESLEELVKQWQGMNDLYQQLFKDDLSKMCLEFFQETMPIGKPWKKSRQSGIPCKHNSYVEHAIGQILEPVISGTKLLPEDCQISLLSLATTTMMERWSSYVLKEEIVFSFYGAQQLQLDFNYIKCWISSEASCLNPILQSSLLSLEVFLHLDGATRLLMLQPRKKKQMDELDVELESNFSAVSSSSVLSSFSGVDIDGYELDILNDKSIPNKQLWLDLRLRGGKSRKGLLPFCLKVQETK